MNILDKTISYFAPESGVKRLQARTLLRYFDAAQPGRLRRPSNDRSPQNVAVRRANLSLVTQARDLDRNHDIARGIINTLVNHIIGQGLTLEPMVKDKKGNLAKSLNEQLSEIYHDWSRFPEVTNELTRPQVERMACRAWLRDGEIFAKLISGFRDDLDHISRVPFSIEMIETDYLPYGIDMPKEGVHDGIRRDGWGRPSSYHVLKRHPNKDELFRLVQKLDDYSEIKASDMVHCKLADRFLQNRGVSIFASVMTRLEDIKDYEESERIAAKIAACLAAVVKKGDASLYVSNEGDQPRTLRMEPGKIIDDLEPGESVDMMDSKRPNVNLETFRMGQMRAVSAGTQAGASSITKNYDNSYAAQRQEMLEQSVHYFTLRDEFVAQFVQPIWRRLVDVSITSGLIKFPSNINLNSIHDIQVSGSGLLWLDPLKEAKAYKELIQLGVKSKSQIQREHNIKPDDTYKEILQERQQDDTNNLIFSGDFKHSMKSNDTTVDIQS